MRDRARKRARFADHHGTITVKILAAVLDLFFGGGGALIMC
jgi:hypothetical protein